MRFPRRLRYIAAVVACAGWFLNGFGARAAVVINEIHYHPVEVGAFDTEGVPLLDLSKDVHEFLELYNPDTLAVTLDGWRLSGGIDYTFPSGTVLPAGGFLVIAQDPARLAAVAAYGLAPEQVLGPYAGQLGNEGDSLRLRDATEQLIDAVNYSPAFPWAISANSLGAEDEWTGLNSSQYQYRGRSLERVSATHPANDPANWLASPLAGDPSPGRANAVTRSVPRPVVLSLRTVQNGDGALLIRSNQPVRVECVFSATNELGDVSVEYFVDDITLTNESRVSVPMTIVGEAAAGKFAAVLPGQFDRRVVRYRIRAERGAGLEIVSPRADDPYGWHAYFISPVRTGVNPMYDCFISSASLTILQANIGQTPRRIVNPDPPGQPRASWNATQPAILVYNGEVFDMQMRHHGSRYNRNSGRNSWKWQFPRYHHFSDGRESMFITDKGEEHRVGSQLHDAADLPAWRCRYVDVFLNQAGRLQRLQQDEMDEWSYRRWAREQAERYPGTEVEDLGGIFKATGVIPFETGQSQGATSVYTNSGEGPYYIGNTALPPAKPGWSARQRCEWTYTPQINGWKGGGDVEELLRGLWGARGDSPTAPAPNLAPLRVFLAANFDVEKTLTYMAIRDWSGPFDNATHNHFLWRRADGRWGMLAWDLDSEFDNPSQTIFWDEQVPAQPDTLRGPHWIKDSFYKAFREEYKQRLWLLNNTLLNPTNFGARGWAALQGFASPRFASVNQQLGLGVFARPVRPVHVAPLNGSNALAPAVLQASPYVHSRTANPSPHASTTWFIRRNPGGYTNPVVRVTSTTNLTSLPVPFEQLEFGQTYFWKCFYTDAEGHPSLDSVETSFVFGVPYEPGALQLSECLAQNDGAIVNGPTAPDFVEVFNSSDESVALERFSLSDNPERPGKFVFPPGTVIPAKGYLTVWCDNVTNAPGLHTGFGLDNDGQTVALFSFAGGSYRLADSVAFGLQIPGRSIGRVDNIWVLNDPTPGALNQAASLGAPVALKVNEWLASSTGGPDWFELYNTDALPVALGGLYLTDSTSNRTNTRVAPLNFIAGHGFRRFFADEQPEQGPRHTNFRLSAGGESILLYDSALTPLNSVTFGPQATDVSQGLLPDATGAVVSFPNAASPEAPNHQFISEVVINELLPNLELRNVGATSISIAGWWLSDTATAPEKFQIPPGTTLAPGGYWSVAQAQLPFAFDSVRGGRAVLSHDTVFRISASFEPYDGHAQGTVPTSVGVDFVRLSAPSFGSVNALPQVGPVVISELHYHPPDLPGDNDDYEYVELANITAGPAPLHAPGLPGSPWRFRDAISFRFPPGISLAGGERVLLVPFDPSTNTAALSNFTAAYSLPPGLRLFGPYEGKLNNDDNSLELVEERAAITTPGLDYGTVPTLLLERVRYTDRAPWPAAADGLGASLQRRQLSGYGNEPTNWFASGISPGAANHTNNPPTVRIVAPLNGASINAGLTIAVEVNAQDSDGVVRLVELLVDGNKVAEAISAPYILSWSNAPLGARLLTARARDSHFGSTVSAPVTVFLTNDPPQVTLTAPGPNASFVLPTNIVLEATASDSDGTIERVKFFDNGSRLGEDTTFPYQLTWTNAGSGTHNLYARALDNRAVATASASVAIRTSRLRNIAYVVPVGSIGGQNFGGALGMDFDVQSPIVVTALGAFDSGADGLVGASVLTVQVFRRNGNTGTVLGGMTFTGANPGTLVESSRFKPLPIPLVLSNGSYTVVGYGHSTENPNGNLCCGPKTWSTDDAGGLIAFVGNSRYLNATPGTFPTTVDTGPVDRYAAGTFEYVPVPERVTIFGQPTNQFIRLGGFFTNRVGAVGQAPLYYQWFFNGAPLAGATNTTYGIASVPLEAQGGYSVIVSNALGAATSQVATLTVLVDPLIVQPPLSQNVVTGATVILSVVLTNTATLPIGYRWRTNNATATTGYTVVNQRTIFLTIPNAQGQYTNFSVVVTNMSRPSGFVSSTATLTFVSDSDLDGLPDAWEQSFFGTPLGADGAADSDGDGLSNRQEYQAGTDPTDPSSYLRIDNFIFAPSATLTFQALSNQTYALEFTESIGGGPAWTVLTEVPARGENRLEVVTDPNYRTNRFYRLRTPR